ncbi:MAG TPA: response regulator transcription factor [Candidatus Limnocylindria bacterium]
MGRTRVQIVDDHFLFAEALGSVIRDLPDYELVGLAVTGPQALSMAQEKQPQIVLLDYHLPGYSAEQLAPRLRAAAPGARIVILTSDTTEGSMVKGVQAGVDGYLTKDRALDDVVQALASVRQGRSALTAEQLATAQALPSDAQADALTGRELEILRLMASGRDSTAIADDLAISQNTVRTHLQNLFAKLGAHSKLEAVTIATRRKLL